MKVHSIALAVALSVSGLAWADHTENHENANTNSQQLSRRAYSAPIEKNTVLEGNAVLEETNAQAEKHYKTLQLHLLSKRPYAAKGTD